MAFDPFGDRDTRGYLRNYLATNDQTLLNRLENHAFKRNVEKALAALAGSRTLGYDEMLDTHRRLFISVYPWAGQDRAALAPDIAIAKGGASDLFAHPADVRRAAEYGLAMGLDTRKMAANPGEVFGAFAYAHPFLDGNGRTIMAVHADLARRAGFHIDWEPIGKTEFLAALTAELRAPGTRLDALMLPHLRPGPLPTERAAASLACNPDLNRSGASPSP
jgi:cell filamentation protein